jgi:sugar (pentulose or hexulose) kinase
MEKVIAIFDVGKTNKKMLLFNEQLKLVFQQETYLPTILDDDNFECDDLDQIVIWIKSSIEALIDESKYELVSINFSTYGASLVFLDKDGKRVTPLYNYLKPMPEGIVEPIYHNNGGRDEFCRCTASPSLGMLNSGMQILWLRKCKPDVYDRVKYILHFPQYLSYCLTGKIVSEFTSIGCHTGLWNFDLNFYHSWLSDEGIHLPMPVTNDKLEKYVLSGRTISVGVGIHDSSASLVPYLQNSKEKFILISTGTWCIFMNPFNSEPLTKEQLDKDTLCYMSILQQQVKSSRLFLGFIHDSNSKRIAEYYKIEPDFYKKIRPDDQLIFRLIKKHKKSLLFFKNGFPADYIDKSVDMSSFTDFREAYHQLVIDLTILAVESLKLITPVEDTSKVIYISGGFALNELFVRLLATFIPGKQVYTAKINNATALGAAIAIFAKTFNKPAPDLNLDIKEYKAFSLS